MIGVWLRSLKTFILKKTILFGLFAICIFVTMLVITFFYGLFQELGKEHLENVFGTDELILYVEEGKESPSLDTAMAFCERINAALKGDCEFCIYGRLEEDVAWIDEYFSLHGHVDENEYEILMDAMSYIPMYFRIEDGDFAPSKLLYQASVGTEGEPPSLLGEYFTKAQFENGEPVCIGLPEDIVYMDEQGDFLDRYRPDENGKCRINGREYTYIGTLDWCSNVPMMPVTAMDGSCPVRKIMLWFHGNVKKSQYEMAGRIADEMLGDAVVLREPEFGGQESEMYFYATMLLCVLMMAVAGIMMAFLYRYILTLRKKQFIIYRLCGLTVKETEGLYRLECMVVTAVFCIAGVLLYHFVLLRVLGGIYEYIETFYSLNTYLLLLVLYVAAASLVQYREIKRTVRQEIAESLKEAG